MALKLPKAPYNTAKAIYAGRCMLRFVRSETFKGVVADTEGVFTLASQEDVIGHALEVGQTLRFIEGTAGVGLTAKEIYYVISVDDDDFKLSATYGGEAVAITTAYTDLTFACVHCLGLKEITPKGEIEMETYEEPDDEGVLRTVDQREKSNKESMEFEMPEALRSLELFDGKLFGMVDGTATLFAPDPQRQAANTIALVSEEDFACQLSSNGDAKLGGGFTHPALKLTSLKAGGIKYQTAAQIVAA